MRKVVAVVQGSLNCDITVRGMTLPRHGQTITGDSFLLSSGGKGANQAVQLAKLGAEVYMIGRVGQDSYGKFLLENLEKAGVHTDYIIRDAEPTGIGMVMCGEEGHYYAMVVPGANGKCSAKDILDASEAIKKADVLMSQLETTEEALTQMGILAERYQIPWIVNTAPAKPMNDKLFAMAHTITPNETETAFYTGMQPEELSVREGWEKAEKIIREKNCNRFLMTLGDKGCYFADSEQRIYMKSFPIKAVDTTAAGDAFNGTYAYAVACKMGIEESLKLANGAGAVAAGRAGAQDSLGTMEEILALIHKE